MLPTTWYPSSIASAQCLLFCNYLGLLLTLIFGPIFALGWVMPKSPPSNGELKQSYLNIDQDRWHYELAGSGGQTLVMLHGFGSDMSQWDDVWNNLTSDDRRLLRLDLPGFGDSLPVMKRYTLDWQIARIKSFLDILHIHNVIWVGYSMGASIAVALAANYPDITQGAILLAPSAYPGSLDHKGLYGWILNNATPRRISRFYGESALYRLIFPRSLALPALDITASYGSLWKTKLKDVKCPTLLMWSLTDEVSKAGFANEIANSIPRASLRWLPDSSAHQILRVDGDKIAGYIKDFTASLGSNRI
jgi:pimeloyl-ACP methyl ester carboxylesterase